MAEVSTVSVASFPPINFGFDDLKTKMNRFTIRFDQWTQSQRQRVLRERNDFAKTITESRGTASHIIVANSQESQKELNKQIELHKARQAELAQGNSR